MAIINRPSNLFQGGHWYTLDGKSCHKVEGKNGKMRATTLRDARQLGLLPSVTGIIGMMDKSQLTQWKMRETAKASIGMDIQPNEDPDTYADRVIDRAMNQVGDAADLGTEIHAALENVLRGAAIECPEHLKVYVSPVIKTLRERGVVVTDSEKVLVNTDEGFAGQVDALFTWGAPGQPNQGILDFKTKRTKPDQKVAAYESHVLQLAAYAATHYGGGYLDRVNAVNIFISTTEPGRIEVVKHDGKRLIEAWKAFRNLAAVWRFSKRFDPRQTLEVGE